LLLKFEREKKDLDAGEKTTEKKKQNIKKIKRTNNINDNSEKKIHPWQPVPGFSH
jgi:hypothetical protein